MQRVREWRRFAPRPPDIEVSLIVKVMVYRSRLWACVISLIVEFICASGSGYRAASRQLFETSVSNHFPQEIVRFKKLM